MKTPSFSMDQSQFYYPGQDILVKESSPYGVYSEEYKDLEKARNWLVVIAAVFAFSFFAISAKLFEYTVLSESSSNVKRTVIAANTSLFGMKRADIVDRNGTVLATSLPTVNLYSDNSKLDSGDIEQAAKELVRTIPSLDYQTMKKRLSKKSRFVYLKHNLTPTEQQEVHNLGYPAFAFENTERRVYPQGNLFSHVLGTVGFENKGMSGIEASFNDMLTSTTEPLKLSLDAAIQYSVRDILADNVAHFKAQGGVALVMDIGSSEIISMVSLPDFNPNLPIKINDVAMFNRSTLGLYEFGSVFKIFNTAIALESGTVKINDKINSSPLVLTRYKTIRDDHPVNKPLSIKEIMIHSSNTASARIALDIGYETQQEYFRRMGFFDEPAIELPEKATPIMPKYWKADTVIAGLSYGYGMAVTPLHVINAVGAVVNGGTFYPASLLTPNPHLKEAGVRVLSDKNSAFLRETLRAVVTDGTGRKSEVAGYNVGGKTGTAEKTAASGGFNSKTVRTTFVAVFPMDKPKYAVLVMLDEPQDLPETHGFKTAGWNATKCVKEIIETIAPALGQLPVFTQKQKENLYQQVGLSVQ